VKRSKRVFTTKSDPAGVKPLDLVQRRFTATAPRRLWGVDITRTQAWQGFAYVAFVTDVFARKIVGFNVASTLRADILPLQALDMAAFTAGGDLTGLTHHCDHGSNYMSLVYTDRIIELGATPSTGSVGDSHDCQHNYLLLVRICHPSSSLSDMSRHTCQISRDISQTAFWSPHRNRYEQRTGCCSPSR